MRRVGLIHMLIAVAALTMWASHAGAQQQVRLTVQQLFKSNHQIEVVAGTEVIWADPHFDRVWFPAGEWSSTRRSRSRRAPCSLPTTGHLPRLLHRRSRPWNERYLPADRHGEGGVKVRPDDA